MTNTEIYLAIGCVFLLCMLGLSLIDRRKVFMDGERAGYLLACEQRGKRSHDSAVLDELRKWKKERKGL